MWRRECSLCGGKLHGNICVECGLDNSKNDDNYKTLKSHADYDKLTHIHESYDPLAGKTLTREQKREMQGQGRAFVKKKSRRKGSSLVLIFAIIPFIVAFIGILGAIGFSVLGIGQEYTSSEPEYLQEEFYDPYENVLYEIGETGEYYENVLEAGNYVGGVHIPEGYYDIIVSNVELNAEGVLTLTSNEQGIYIYESFGEEMMGELLIEDLRIYEGAELGISGAVTLQVSSENAVFPMENMANPNTESFTVSGDFVVGEEVKPGVYDLYGIFGAGVFDYTVEFPDGTLVYGGELIGEEGNDLFYPYVYRNVVLPEGVQVYLDNMTVDLIPSETIKNEEYLDYYR